MENNKALTPEYPLTKGRLNKMLKYYKGKPIEIKYHVNDEIIDSRIDTVFRGTYSDFTINEYENQYICFKLKKGNSNVVYFGFYKYQCSFIGPGMIKESNNGPYCYFIIKKLGVIDRIRAAFFA